MRPLVLLVLSAFIALGTQAKVLIVADEFPVMEVIAARLKSEERIESTIISQKDLSSSLAIYEAVIVYIHGALSEEAENAFIDYTKTGKLVVLHHSISSGKRKNAQWFSFLGVSLPEGDLAHGGYKWIEGVSFDLLNLEPNHFIMTNKVVYPEHITCTDFAGVSGKKEWVKPAGQGTIINFMPGHRKQDFENAAYGRIVVNAVIYKP